MSYTKVIYRNQVLTPVNEIQQRTLDDNDFTDILDYLNTIMDVADVVKEKITLMGEIWNEVVADVLSSIFAASSGFYRLSIISLRSILELGCNALFYEDHLIEFGLYQKHNAKSDRYVTTLIKDHAFFTTKYIETFHTEIKCIQSSDDSVSNFLKKLYGDLSDVVHGRYKTLIQGDQLRVEYNKSNFKLYEGKLKETLSVLTLMHVLRNGAKSNNMIRLGNLAGVVKL